MRKLFELGEADRDALHTTSPLQDRSEIKSKLNPFNCADQWVGQEGLGPGKVENQVRGRSVIGQKWAL